MSGSTDCGHIISMMLQGMALTQGELRTAKRMAESFRNLSVGEIEKAIRQSRSGNCNDYEESYDANS